MAQSLSAVAIISILWVAFGYSLAFVGDGAWLGTFERVFLKGMTMGGANPLAKTIPESLFMLYQMTFAIITVALVAGSIADRVRFSAFILVFHRLVVLVWSRRRTGLGRWLCAAGARFRRSCRPLERGHRRPCRRACASHDAVGSEIWRPTISCWR
jgi:ammonia channel protein AmtB